MSCGQRKLTQKEKNYYETALGGQYRIGGQLGRSGEMSSAFLLTDKQGHNCVLKIPNHLDRLSEWKYIQEKSLDLQKKYVGNYHGAVYIPKTLKTCKDFIVEELATGQEFSDEVYHTLSSKEKKRVAQDFAEFLNFSHQRTLTGKAVKLHPNQQQRVGWQDTYDYYAPCLTKQAKIKLQKEIQRYNQQGDPEVLAFRDYRSQNMFWDSQKKRLSIIDFGCVKYASVYEEFTPYAAASGRISYLFLKDVIREYNKMPKEHPLFIDLERVKHNCFLGLYHEYARCSIGKNPPDKFLSLLQSDLKSLKELTEPKTLKNTLAKSSKKTIVEKGKLR